jgi:hypothetical protein
MGQTEEFINEHFDPAGHGVGIANATDAHMNPDGQVAGSAEPSGQTCPIGHCSDTTVKPDELQKYPPVHGIGVESCEIGQNVPTGHAGAPADPPGQYFPAVQGIALFPIHVYPDGHVELGAVLPGGQI